MTETRQLGGLKIITLSLRRWFRERHVLRAARRGDFAPLLKDAETALDETLWRCGSAHPDTGRKLAVLATVHRMRGEIADAEPLLRRAIALLKQSHDEADHSHALALSEQLAELLRENGGAEAAEIIYGGLLAAHTRRHRSSAHADVARTLDNIALAMKEQGRIPEAKTRHRDALLIWEQVRGPGSPEVARCLTRIASLYLSEHCYAEAEPLLLRAVAEWKSSPNPNDLYTIITLSCCGELYRGTGRDGEARGAEAAAKAVLARYAK